MRARKRTYLSLTPMIDVVFILLLFFLLTTQFQSQKILPINVSKGDVSSQEAPITRLEIGGIIRLEGAEISYGQWEAFLKEGSKNPLAIRADDGIKLNQLIQYIDGAREGGISEIILVEKVKQ